MLIKSIKVSNFKSFKKLDIELRDFNLIIGPNASGKSNFIQIFRFLRDKNEFGLDNAIGIQSGVEYFRNLNIGDSEATCIQVSFKGVAWDLPTSNDVMLTTNEYSYLLNIRYDEKKYFIEKEELTLTGALSKIEKKEGKSKISRSLGKAKLLLSDVKGHVSAKFIEKPKNVNLSEDSNFYRPIMSQIIHDLSRDIVIFDIDPKLSKKAIPIAGMIELKEDGGNLALVLKNIISDDENKRKFLNLITYTLPYLKEVDVEKFADRSLILNVLETYFDKQKLPASLMSDGTIILTAMIVAFYFDRKPLLIIEEPERNIHPRLMSAVVDMMKDASRQKQIIATTHNPELLKHADLKDVFVVRRDENGFSQISQPADDEKVKTFLKHDLGLEDLFVQNLLGA